MQVPLYREQMGYIKHVKQLLRKYVNKFIICLLIRFCICTSRPERLIRLGRLININNLRAYLLRGLKFVLPYQSSKLYILSRLEHVILYMNMQY